MRLRLFFLLGFALLSVGASLAQAMPDAVAMALARAQIPQDAVSLVVVDADGKSAPRLSHRPEVPMNPASVMKLVTSYAALDLLGPAYTWRTPVWLDGPVSRGVLKGNLVIQGQGDPKLVLERLWLLLRRVQGLGVQKIDGDIVLDRRAFQVPDTHPGDFDGEPLRPYNAAPDALLLNLKSVVMTFVPDPAGNVARVSYDLPLWGVQMPASVPLLVNKPGANAVDCGDYRSALKADFSDPGRIRFAGSYPASCGEKVWPVAYVEPKSYNARALEGLWRSMGGQLSGSVREGAAPVTPASFEAVSPTLTEVVRDINKFSNNVMAQQVFLTLGRASLSPADRQGGTPAPVATRELARSTLQGWWQQRIGQSSAPLMDNGSGLSRAERISAQSLAKLLQVAYASPWMPELMSSLPIVGLDGTLKRSRAVPASGHLKTGSLRDVMAVAGYVHAASGKNLCLVVMVNHPNAAAAKPALEALLDWAVSDN